MRVAASPPSAEFAQATDGARGGSVIVGAGNPFLTDDAIGLIVAKRVHALLADPGFELREVAAGGLELIETVLGFRRAVVIDAVRGGAGPPGTVYRADLPGEWPGGAPGGSHEIGLLEGLELVRRLGIPVPERLELYAIEVEDPFTFGTRLSGAVAAAADRAAAQIADEIRAGESDAPGGDTGQRGPAINARYAPIPAGVPGPRRARRRCRGPGRSRTSGSW